MKFYNKLKVAWDYFLYHPDKTEVILYVYVLNPIHNITSKCLLTVVNTTRKIILKCNGS